ncbi:hypothetical protein [Catellatospora tritici]|uniref:hypothetical protein n=1 Tax=Catellatospora tritici TaxID=2851566 RepID=UPI001C2DE90F|nr:hypothetical protein [Catellatospora tritici]MBV1853108.1 hypothetical protein [Catellatospora tritici]
MPTWPFPVIHYLVASNEPNTADTTGGRTTWSSAGGCCRQRHGGTGGALLAPRTGWTQEVARGRAGTLDPTKIRKYAAELALPGVMPPVPHRHDLAEYVVAVRRVRQQGAA